jgi:hypothetical protein
LLLAPIDAYSEQIHSYSDLGALFDIVAASHHQREIELPDYVFDSDSDSDSDLSFDYGYRYMAVASYHLNCHSLVGPLFHRADNLQIG